MSKNSLPSSGGMGVVVAVGLSTSVIFGSIVAVDVCAEGADPQAERALANNAVNKRSDILFI
jgi:hypothetical protein